MDKRAVKSLYTGTDWLIVRSIISILGGILLCMYPAILASGLVIGTGILLILAGVITLIVSRTQRKSSLYFWIVISSAVVFIALGVLFILKSDFLATWVVFIIGLMLIILALVQMVEIFNMRRYEESSNPLAFLSPLVLFALGIIVVLHPDNVNNFFGYLAAGGLIYYAVIGFVLAFRTRKLIKKHVRAQEKLTHAVEVSEEVPETPKSIE